MVVVSVRVMGDFAHWEVDAAWMLRAAEYSIVGDADNGAATSPRCELLLLDGGPKVEVISFRRGKAWIKSRLWKPMKIKDN